MYTSSAEKMNSSPAERRWDGDPGLGSTRLSPGTAHPVRGWWASAAAIPVPEGHSVRHDPDGSLGEEGRASVKKDSLKFQGDVQELQGKLSSLFYVQG